ncbi:MAG TPA: hypothetical protein VK604_27460 [Bryobacteraceae bacterium]|nr:hypothetical protein [Bryobacteraceae bacterium]
MTTTSAPTTILEFEGFTANPQLMTSINKGEFNVWASALLGVGVMMLGTGSIAPHIIGTSTSSVPAIVIRKPVDIPKPQLELVSVDEQLIAIRSYLSMNTKELATALRVGRATVYAWERGAKLNIENQTRLQQLFMLARRWRSMCSEPLSELVRKPLNEDGLTVVELLSREFPNDEDISNAFDLAKTFLTENQTLSIRERKRQLGFAPRPTRGRAMALDQL